MAPPFQTPCRNQRQIQRKDLFFLEVTMFLGKELTKFGQIQSYNFFLLLFDQVPFQSNVVSIKCYFNQVSFDQMSFDQMSFDQVSFDQVSFDQVSFDQVSFDQMSFDQVSFDQVSFDQVSFDQLSGHDAYHH